MNWLRKLLSRRRLAHRLKGLTHGEHECNALGYTPGTVAGRLRKPRPTPAALTDEAVAEAKLLERLEKAYADSHAISQFFGAQLDRIEERNQQLLGALQAIYAVHHGKDPDRYNLLALYGIDMDPDDMWRQPLREAVRHDVATLIAEITGVNPATRQPHTGRFADRKSAPSTNTPERRHVA